MAKRKGSNIQRRNLTKKTPSVHETLHNPKKAAPAPTDPEFENSYFFTTVGMFAGMIIGLFFDLMALGFGVGLVIGGIIDYILGEKRKKKLAERLGETEE